MKSSRRGLDGVLLHAARDEPGCFSNLDTVETRRCGGRRMMQAWSSTRRQGSCAPVRSGAARRWPACAWPGCWAAVRPCGPSRRLSRRPTFLTPGRRRSVTQGLCLRPGRRSRGGNTSTTHCSPAWSRRPCRPTPACWVRRPRCARHAPCATPRRRACSRNSPDQAARSTAPAVAAAPATSFAPGWTHAGNWTSSARSAARWPPARPPRAPAPPAWATCRCRWRPKWPWPTSACAVPRRG